MRRGRVLILIVILEILLSGCMSVWEKKYKDNSGVMYGMIYDGGEEGVGQVRVRVNGKEKAVSDVQGRFVIKFMYGEGKKKQRIELEKEGYERVEEEFYYEPMSLLHLKMESGEELVRKGEEYIDEGEYERAEEVLMRSVRVEGVEEESLFLLGVIKLKEGRREEAEEMFERVKEIGADKGERKSYFKKKEKAVK